jgi:hypothetical protein
VKDKKKALKKLRELSEMFDIEESAVVQTHSRVSSESRDPDNGSIRNTERRRARKVSMASDSEDEDEADEKP